MDVSRGLRKLGLGVASLAAAGALAGVALAGNGPQKTVWICHFAGNTAPASWGGGGTTLTGDYVLYYKKNGPLANQISYCLNHGGLGVLSVAAAAAEHGHKTVQLLDRISGYPVR